MIIADFSQTFVVETNGSSYAIGAVLLQQERLVACYSKKMALHLKKVPAYVWELYVIVETIKKWH